MTMFTRSFSNRFVGILGGLMILPVLAACAPETAETPTPPPTPPAPEAAQPQAEPTATGTVAEVVTQDDSFSTLASAVEAAGLADTLQQEGPYTVFAPTNQAFEALPEGTLERLLQPENRETLRQILSYHAVPGELTAAELQPGNVETLEGGSVDVQVDEAANEVRVNDAQVTRPDLQASNGVIHGIDQVLLPPNVQL